MGKTHFFEIILVFLITLVAYGYFFSGRDWNTNSRLAMVKSVVEENRFEIDSYHTGFLTTFDKALVNGHFYSDKAIGSSLIGIAFYKPVYKIYTRFIRNRMSNPIFFRLMNFFAISLLSAFLAPFLYSFVKKISNSVWFALLVSLSICLGTPLYKYSTLYYGHALAAVFLFTGFFIWFSMKGEEKISLKKALMSGYLLGFAIITEYQTGVIAGGIGLYILYVLWKKQALADVKIYISLGLGAFIPIALQMAYNAVVFGSPFSTGYSFEVFPTFVAGQSIGLLGIGWPNLNTLFYMTFHTTMGIFWQAPVLLLAFWGWFRMWQDRQYRAEAVFSFGVSFAYFLILSGYYMWWGGFSSTPRGLIPVFPFFGIPLAFLFKKPERFFVLALGLISIFQMFILTAASNDGLSIIVENMPNTSLETMFGPDSIIYSVFFQNFIAGQVFDNRGNEFFGLKGLESLIPLFVVEACFLVGFMAVVLKRNKKVEV